MFLHRVDSSSSHELQHGGRKERGEGLVRCRLTLLFFPSTRSSQGADPSPGPDTEPPRHHIHPYRFCEQPLVPNLGHGAGAGPNTQGPERGWTGWREGGIHPRLVTRLSHGHHTRNPSKLWFRSGSGAFSLVSAATLQLVSASERPRGLVR